MKNLRSAKTGKRPRRSGARASSRVRWHSVKGSFPTRARRSRWTKRRPRSARGTGHRGKTNVAVSKSTRLALQRLLCWVVRPATPRFLDFRRNGSSTLLADSLAAIQAPVTEPASDAQPGKILHELRHGEMANLGEVPFGRYYGSIDATPLFVMLAGMYLERTGDLAFIRDIWPNVTAALAWIDRFGDSDGDGFVEYSRAVQSGLANQGWKDSYDAIVHDDGRLAEGPIALCEVQGYVFAARRQAGQVAQALGLSGLSGDLLRQANELQNRFESTFWCEDRGIYALALDGSKRPCKVYSSNALHTLFT